MENSAVASGSGLLKDLFREWSGRPAESVQMLPQAGSDRRYFRLQAGDQQAIGVLNADDRENVAFWHFSKHFHALGLPVPEMYAERLHQGAYLQEDLGDLSLLAHLQQRRTDASLPSDVLELYAQALRELARMQVKGGAGLDYRLCHPRADFDRQSMKWDLSYFKYYFLRPARINFDEQLLEDDFDTLIDFLLSANTRFFMFRDFQARNIMVQGDRVRFIDYQGGRRGALAYDVASLLHQAKADIPAATKVELLETYIEAVSKLTTLHQKSFRSEFQGYSLIRVIQTLGAYGFRGLFERRPHFLESIPYAIRNVEQLLAQDLPVDLPVLRQCLLNLRQAEPLQGIWKDWTSAPKELTVTVCSFSYKQGLPEDSSGNGGGFLFDCRAVHNPGRYEPYKRLTGRDQPVIDFLLSESRITQFIEDAKALVDPAVETYIERGFTHLLVGFGCTGGQHRSVYSADQMAKHLEKKYGVKVNLQHIVQEAKNWQN